MNTIIILIYSYLLFGIYFILFNIKPPKLYIGLILFFAFKWIFNYRKCTISRIECLIRGVKKEEGYINRILNTIVDLRYDNNIYMIILLCIILLIHSIILFDKKDLL
jgi:hypothetical protein